MKLKTQKIICFIPIINLIVLFIWVFSYHNKKISLTHFLKVLAMMFLSMLILSIPRIVISVVFESKLLNDILLLASIYIIPLVLGLISIWDQRKRQ